MRARSLSLLGWAALLGSPARAVAEPQWNVAVDPGVCGAHAGAQSELCFYGGLRADVLFGRERSSDPGFGPALELGTVGFDDLRLSAGASLLLPMSSFPVVLSAAPLMVSGERTSFGVASRLFWGFREYNHGGSYSAASGLLVGLDSQIGGKNERVWQISAQVDAMWLSLPVLLLYAWARGPSD